MLDSNTKVKMYDLKLNAMATEFERQMLDPSCKELSFEERIALLVDSEWHRKKDNRIARLLKNAKFNISSACIEDIEYHPDRKLDKQQFLKFASCNYIAENLNIIIMGATGCGKTFLSCALGNAACRNSYSTMYARLPGLLGELAIARNEGQFSKVIKQYQKVKLLILDEWLLHPLKDGEARDLFEIIEARVGSGSTIFCSQFAIDGWHTKIGDSVLADSLLDRIVHSAYKITVDGKDSMRKRKGIDSAGA